MSKLNQPNKWSEYKIIFVSFLIYTSFFNDFYVLVLHAHVLPTEEKL